MTNIEYAGYLAVQNSHKNLHFFFFLLDVYFPPWPHQLWKRNQRLINQITQKQVIYATKYWPLLNFHLLLKHAFMLIHSESLITHRVRTIHLKNSFIYFQLRSSFLCYSFNLSYGFFFFFSTKKVTWILLFTRFKVYFWQDSPAPKLIIISWASLNIITLPLSDSSHGQLCPSALPLWNST